MKECPKCTGDSRVVDSRSGSNRNDSGDYLRRRRACDGCGYRYTTYEMSDNDYKDYQVMLKNITLIKEQLLVVTRSFETMEKLSLGERNDE